MSRPGPTTFEIRSLTDFFLTTEQLLQLTGRLRAGATSGPRGQALITRTRGAAVTGEPGGSPQPEEPIDELRALWAAQDRADRAREECPPIVDLAPGRRARIELRPATWERLLEYASTSADGKETGGWLDGYVGDLGTLDPRARRICVEMVRGLDVLERHADSAIIDLQRSADLPLIGGWHTHPSGATEPSDADRRAGQALRENERSGSPAIEVIVTPDGNGRWSTPTVSGWVIRRRQSCEDLAGQVVCEPADVRVA